MPRAHRHFLPGHVWHITHRCHQREFLLRFKEDRRNWRVWLCEARRRFGLCVLDYVVTSNHVHLLVLDQGRAEVAHAMQLVAGRTAQAYNDRKDRSGAFWQDRYHATAVDTDEHLHRCLTYIDLNMVRAGVVPHPMEWETGGFREIQQPRERYKVIDVDVLARLCSFSDVATFRKAHAGWIADALAVGVGERDERWSESVAVGRRAFVEDVRRTLRVRTPGRRIHGDGESWSIHEPEDGYVTSPAGAKNGSESER